MRVPLRFRRTASCWRWTRRRAGNGDANDPSTGGVSLIHASSGIEEWLVTVPAWAGPLTFSPDGTRVVVQCGGESIRFLETATGIVKQEIRPAAGGQGGRWDGFAMGAGGQILAIGVVNKEQAGGVEVWSTQRGDQDGPPAAAAPGNTAPGGPQERNFKTAQSVKTIACSEDGKLVAVANGGPTMILLDPGTSRVKDNWKPAVEILDARTGKTVAVLQLTTADEDAVLGATERVSHFEVTALAFSPDGKVVAVGTSIGQVKIYDARTGALCDCWTIGRGNSRTRRLRKTGSRSRGRWGALPRWRFRLTAACSPRAGARLAILLVFFELQNGWMSGVRVRAG